ncbi:MAG: hypothetical protein HY294_15000 [Candidatus Rokubacteria bacterium]|nr:hypothetical protein [Candidatus Rokubacteria bacterium]
MSGTPRGTDTIPRVRIPQIFDVLSFLADSAGGRTFDEVRLLLRRRSHRASASPDAMSTAARHILDDLQRLGLARVGTLPRKRSEVERLKHTPCEIEEAGALLAARYRESRGRAFDELLVLWMNRHPYFRTFMVRVLRAPLYVPDVTSIKQFNRGLLSKPDPAELAEQIAEGCEKRLLATGYPAERGETLKREIYDRLSEVWRKSMLLELDSKALVDTVEDNVVLPAMLAAEELPFDAVTFERLLWAAEDFLCAAWTSSHPEFTGRVVFGTCGFEPSPLEGDSAVTGIIHRGRAFAEERFFPSLASAYRQLAGASHGYVDAYALRALVCAGMGIQPRLFARCLETLLLNLKGEQPKIFTELPFKPPPKGEDYIEIGTRRIGQLKLSE